MDWEEKKALAHVVSGVLEAVKANPEENRELVTGRMAWPDWADTHSSVFFRMAGDILSEAGQIDHDTHSTLKHLGISRTPLVPPGVITCFEDIPVTPLEEVSNGAFGVIEDMRYHFYGWRLAEHEGVLRWWTGHSWQRVTREMLQAQTLAAFGWKAGKLSPQKLKLFRMVLQAPGLFRSDRQCVYFKDTVFDVSANRNRPPEATDGIFRTLPYDYAYGSKATCPKWLKFLRTTFKGDPQRIDLMQEWLGYMLTESYEHENLMLLLGPGGSTVGRVLEALVGPESFTGDGKLSQFSSRKFLKVLRDKTVCFIDNVKYGDGVHSKAPSYLVEICTRMHGSHRLEGKHYPSRVTIASDCIPGILEDRQSLSAILLILIFEGGEYAQSDLEKEVQGIAMWALQGLVKIQNKAEFAWSFTRPDADEHLLPNNDRYGYNN